MSGTTQKRRTLNSGRISLWAMRLVTFLAIFALLSHSSAQFRSTQWTTDSGLPQNIIRGIVQTPDGYLWVATLNGVARFDGVRFTVFDKSNSPGITVNRFAAMVAGAQGDLWLYGESGAIIRYHDGEFHTLGVVEGVRSNSARGITSDGHGHVWILVGGELLRWNETANHFEPIADKDDVSYRPLNWDGTGFWGARGQQLYCFSHGKPSIHEIPDYLQLEKINKVAVGADGAIWLALPDGRFARYFEDRWQLSSQPIQIPFQGREKSAWRGTIDNHLDRTLIFPSGGLEKAIRYNTIVEDDEHNVWVGSEGQALYRIQKQTIHVYSKAQGLVGENIYPVLLDRRNDMWVGTWPAGLTQFHGEAIKTYTMKDGLPGLVTALADDPDGNLWVGTHNGLAVLSQGRIHRPENMPEDLPVIQCILKTSDGSLLLGTPNGVYKYNVQEKRPGSFWVDSQPKLLTGDVRVIIENKSGDLWLGGYSGLTEIHDGKLTHWTEEEGLPSNNVRSIYQDPQGVLWVGTYDGGLGRYFNGQWTRYNEKNGLFDNGVFQILEDAHANFWMSSNRGIFRVDKKQLNDVAAGSRSSVITVSYGRSDGMLNAECNGGLWPAGAKASDGKLWFPTQQGVAIVDPESVTRNMTPPRVVIESIALDHAPANLGKPIAVKPGQGGLEIQYTALSFSKPEQLTFRYTMQGLDTNWEDVGYRRTAYFSHLPPGNYIFRVMAANSDGVWSATQSSALITVLPPFYLTGWFTAAMSAVTLIVMYALWSYRTRQFEERQATQQAFSQQLIASQENERRRISGELHDSLGQRLIVIKNLTHFLLRPKAASQSEEDRRQTIEEISTEVSFAIDETRTISYNLRPFQLDRLGLSKAIEALIKSASNATDIRFSTSIPNIDESFPEDLRINFYRIVQEGVNNVIKHSEATEAEVSIEKTSRGITFSIRDNGVGFASEQKISVIGKGGFGLTGIRERAALLGGIVKIQSHPGTGTHLTIDFDLMKHHRA